MTAKNTALTEEANRLRAQEKTFAVHRRGFEARSSKLNRLSNQVQALSEELGAAHAGRVEAQTALRRTEAESRVLRENESALLQDREQGAREVGELRT